MSEIKPLDSAHTALLVLDMHESVAGPDAEDGAGAHAIEQNVVAHIASLLDAARAGGLQVIHVHHRSAKGVRPTGRLPELFRELADEESLQEGDPGMDVLPGLEPVDGDLVIHKERVSAFTGTELDIVLRAADVDTLILTGTWTNLSVESSARYGADIGYRIVLASDGLCSISREWHEGALSLGLSLLCEIGTTAEVLAALK
ncbi:cysteine hydrolase family protein [Streptomyces griseorubiginosus]|uniref:cysteine hydrolase family protein n=1 Tax=Streptomyces griseorubiginosus TaxID=67304 RepID=UPI00363B68FB